MTVQSVIQVSLVMVLVWQIWMLHVRGWAGWKREGRRKQGKGREGKRGDKKPKKPFEGLTRKPVCELCETEAEKQERSSGSEDENRRRTRASTLARKRSARIAGGWGEGISSRTDIQVRDRAIIAKMLIICAIATHIACRNYSFTWSLAFLFVVTASAVQKAQKRLKPLLRTPISSAFIVAYPKMWAF